jgi:hypothetical protein
MNVGNRKLFSNRDARSKLSSMGGIMASSPELMGEAQRFAEGSKDAVAANNGGTRLGTRMPVEESNELVKKIAEQSSRLGGFDESQGLTEGDLKSAITTVYFDSIRMIERLKRDPNLPASEVSDERLQSALMNRLTEMFGVDESIINETIAEVQPAAVDKNQAIPFAEQSPFRINPYRDFDKRSIADGIMSADPRRTRPSNEEVMALQGFTGTRAPVESPFGQESVDQLGSPSLLQQFRQTEMPSNRLGGSGPSGDVLRTESPQGLGLESLDLVRPSGDLSIDQMMNTASAQPAAAREGIETLSASEPEFVPRFPGDTQFQQDMVARDTPSGAVSASQSTDFPSGGPPSMGFPTALEQARLEKQFQSDGMLQSEDLLASQATGGEETPAEREARILAESRALIAERDPSGEAIARIDDGTSISSRVNDIVEPVEVLSESEQLLASQQDAQRMMEINATPPATPPDGYQIITNRSGAVQSVNQNRINPEKIARITKSFADGEITEAQYQGQKKEYENAILQDNAHQVYSAEQQAETDVAKAEADAAQAVISEATLDSRIAEAEANNDTALVAALSETAGFGGYDEIARPSTLNKDLIERINAEGTSGTEVKPEATDPRFDEIDDGTGTDFSPLVPDVMEKIEVDGAGGAGTGTTLFSPSTVKDYQKMYADMLGGKDKDSAKDKWNDFAMLGFAIAAGQDPNALTNIAQGLFATEKMKKEDRSIEQARQDKINMMAIQSADQDRRAAIAAGASVTAANLAYERQVNLATTKFNRAGITAGKLADANLEKAKATSAGSFSTPDRLFKSTFETLVKSKEQDVIDKVITQDEVFRQAKIAASEQFPNSRFAVPVTPVLTQQEAEAAAKAAGETEFVFQGERFRVR